MAELTSLRREELLHVVALLTHRAGGLPDALVAEARVQAATRRLAREKQLLDAAAANGRPTARLRTQLARAEADFRAAAARGRQAAAHLARVKAETGR